MGTLYFFQSIFAVSLKLHSKIKSKKNKTEVYLTKILKRKPGVWFKPIKEWESIGSLIVILIMPITEVGEGRESTRGRVRRWVVGRGGKVRRKKDWVKNEMRLGSGKSRANFGKII